MGSSKAPSVKLAVASTNMYGKQALSSVRLATANSNGDKARAAIRLATLSRKIEMEALSSVRLAATGAMFTGATGDGKYRYPHHKENEKANELGLLAPALLVSFYYYPAFARAREKYVFRDWVMDSGAYSAYNSGVEIKLQDYIDACKELIATDDQLTEVYCLDVIGDWKASLKNCEEMWRQGVKAIPCFHAGEPEHVLMSMAREYPKIALGGMVGLGMKGKIKFMEQCFARVWPKPIHGFGQGSEKVIMRLPFHSVDATNWELGPTKFGRWQSYGRMSVRGNKQNLRAEVEFYLNLERRANEKWAREMAQIAHMVPTLREPKPAPTAPKKRRRAKKDD